MASGFNFKPGNKAFWVWYNAPTDPVYSFSVQPNLVSDLLDSVALQGSAAVTNVNYYVHTSYNSPKQQVHIEVTNTGSNTINYDLLMSQIHI